MKLISVHTFLLVVCILSQKCLHFQSLLFVSNPSDSNQYPVMFAEIERLFRYLQNMFICLDCTLGRAETHKNVVNSSGFSGMHAIAACPVEPTKSAGIKTNNGNNKYFFNFIPMIYTLATLVSKFWVLVLLVILGEPSS